MPARHDGPRDVVCRHVFYENGSGSDAGCPDADHDRLLAVRSPGLKMQLPPTPSSSMTSSTPTPGVSTTGEAELETAVNQ